MNRFPLAAAILTIAAVPTSARSADLVLNGSFESNGNAGCAFNLTNQQFSAVMSNATAFGTTVQPSGPGEIDIYNNNCDLSKNAQSGTSYVGIHAQDIDHVDAFSLALSSALVAGVSYRLDFYGQGQDAADAVFFGLSTQAPSFGLTLGTAIFSKNSWLEREITFTAAGGESFVTFRAGTAANSANYIFLDSVSLTPLAAVPEPASWGLMGLGVLCVLARRRLQAA